MKTWKLYVVAIFALSLLGICTAHGGDIGELDTTFGEDGKVITSFGQFGDQAYAIALQADGKILAAGSASNGVDFDIAIARYNEDGSLDTSFGKEGKVRSSLGDGDDEIAAIAVQDDGYIVAAGYTVVDGGRDFVLVRLNPNGDFDHSFGEGGIVVTGLGNLDDEITAMTIDDEGRIVVCGYVTGTAGSIVAIARYVLESGDPDTTFGDQGVILIDIGDDALTRSIDVDAEGRIVVAGSYYHVDRTELMVLRFLDSGDLDTGFGTRGVGVPANQEEASEGYGVRLMEDGRIVVAGTIGQTGDQDAAVYRFTESGQPDTSFGENGMLVTSASDEDDMALAVDVLGNVVSMSGYSTFNTKRDFLFVSVEETVDKETNISLNLKTGNFLSGGKKYNSVFDLTGQQEEEGEETTEKSVFSTTPFGYTDDVSYAVVLQSDGKAVSAGFSEQDGVSSFALARYTTPVTNATAGGVYPAVSWIITKEPTNVNRTGAFTGGTILASGKTIKQRGVVYSIAPDPVYKEGEDATDPDNPTPDPTPDPDPGDTTPPVITINSPSADEVLTQVSVDLDVTTDEVAECKYSSASSGRNFDTMTAFDNTNATAHTVTFTVVDNESYEYWVHCRDDALNENEKSVSFSVNTSAGGNVAVLVGTSFVDTSAPQVASSSPVEESPDTQLVVYNGSPYGEIDAGSSMTYIGVYTSDESACRYSSLTDQDFGSMSESMATSDKLAHIAKVEGLLDDHDYSYFVQCQDVIESKDTSGYEISFRVASTKGYDTQPYRSLTNTLGNFFVATAYAQAVVPGNPIQDQPPEAGTPSSVFDLSTPDYSMEGSTDDGGGVGSYSSILDNLKPGTFYYVRAYALDENNNVYYGNQVGIKTADSCFVATAAFGTIFHPYVKVLRSFRDQYMITNVIGRNLVNLYYHYSPPAADYIAARPFVRGIARVALLPIVGFGWLVLNIGFVGLLLFAVVIIIPSTLVLRSYRRLETL